MKTIISAIAVSVALTAAADPFWKDDKAPDLSRSADSTSTYACATEVEGRPYVEVSLGVKFRTIYAPGFLLMLR